MIAADILSGLLRVNLAAGAAILGVVALRKLVRAGFGPRVAYGLWLLPVLAATAVLTPAREVLVVRPAAPVFAAASRVLETRPAASFSAATSLDPSGLLVGLWLAGVLVAAVIMVWLQQRFASRARGGAIGPAVVGVITPRIVTPADFASRYSPGEQTLVLAHERVHIAHQDSRLNGLVAAAQCLSWFNPLVHLAAHLMRIDQELACDEAVVARFPGARRTYADVLLKTQLAVLPLPLGCYWPSRSEHPLVERIAMLRSRGVGRTRRSAGVCALTALCAAVGFAAWAAQPADVRITTSRTSDSTPAQPDQTRVAAARRQTIAAANRLAVHGSDEQGVAPAPASAPVSVKNGREDEVPADATASRAGRAEAESDTTSSAPAPNPLRPVTPLVLVAAPGPQVSAPQLVPVSNQTQYEGQPLGPGHYVQRSGLRSSLGCNDWLQIPPTYRVDTPPIAPGHIITNLRFDLVGSIRCGGGNKYPTYIPSALCELRTDQPDRKSVWFILYADSENCVGPRPILRRDDPAIRRAEMVVSYDVQ
jgi:beta-lactamase regulating signal transducer with metallopeptidase domain